MISKPKPSAVVFAMDIQKLARFYKEVVGMAEVHADEDHVVLDEGGTRRIPTRAGALHTRRTGMPNFEEIFKFLTMFGGFLGIVIAAGFGFKKLGGKQAADPDVVDRLAEAESRIGELEERLDFSKRALTEIRARVQILPG